MRSSMLMIWKTGQSAIPLMLFGAGGARDPVEIAPNVHERESGRAREQILDLDVLAETEFEDEKAARPQPLRRVGDEARDQTEAVDAAVERHSRLVIAHLGLQRGPGTIQHIRRIGDDGVQLAVDAVDE